MNKKKKAALLLNTGGGGATQPTVYIFGLWHVAGPMTT